MTKVINFVCNQENCINLGTYAGCKLDTVSFSPASDGSRNLSCNFFQQRCTVEGCRNLGLSDMGNGEFLCKNHNQEDDTDDEFDCEQCEDECEFCEHSNDTGYDL